MADKFKNINAFAYFLLLVLSATLAYFVGKNGEQAEISLKDIQGVSYFEEKDNLYDPNGCENFFYDYNGQKIEAQNGSVMSNWISCQAGQSITRNGIATNVVCFFDKNKSFIERVDCYGASTIRVPDNDKIAYVRMAVQMADDRKIVYGDSIPDDNISGNYYTIDDLKIFDKNLVEDSNVIESPDGSKWKIMVDDQGNLSAKNVTGTIRTSDLPNDFPEYTITGSSKFDGDFLVSMKGETDSGYNYIFVMTNTGDVKWYKKIPNQAINFRKIQYADGTIRYAYQQYDKTIGDINGGVAATHIVLMDENFNEIQNDIRPLVYGSIKEAFCESHDYKILGDGHYILTTISLTTVDNIPGYEGKNIQVVNAIIQEQKDGKVLMQWESSDYPELYAASILNNDYSSFEAGITNKYTDYAHINSIAVDPNSYDLLISCRSIGLIKLDRHTGNIVWVMGRGRNDLSGIDLEEIGMYQHDARYLPDGSITIFDNSGGEDNTSRVCRYWINEQSLNVEKIEIHTTQYKSSAMGGAFLEDEETSTYLIAYGAGVPDFAFEERNFSTNEINMRLKFDDGTPLYRIFRGVEITPTC